MSHQDTFKVNGNAGLPAWAARYIGIPWVDRGRDPRGVDCYGLVWLAYRDVFGIDLPRFDARYPSVKDRVAVSRLFFEETTGARWHRVLLTDATVPDALHMMLAGANHVGIVVAPGRFLHVLPGRETCIERLVSPAWMHRVESVYRHEAFVLAETSA